MKSLPPLLEQVRVPQYFSPSTVSLLARCPLRVFMTGSGDRPPLPPGPEAILGTILHHVREQLVGGRWGDTASVAHALDTILNDTVRKTEASLSADSATRGMIPLEEAVGRARWRERVRQLRLSVASLVPPQERADPRPMNWCRGSYRKPGGEVEPDCFSTGPEARLVCNALRLKGRPDHVRERPGGVVVITDYKSSASSLLDDELPESIQLQMQFYGLLATSLRHSPCELYVDGAAKIPVDWDDQIRSACLEQLQELLQRYPPGAVLAADHVATPGTVCSGCAWRSACPSYLHIAPTWWPAGVGHPRPIPFDSWGQVEEITGTPERADIRLRDAAARLVLVRGVDLLTRDLQVVGASTLSFFDLEPSEPLIQHGVRIHPRSFHEYPPGGRGDLKKATRTQVALGA